MVTQPIPLIPLTIPAVPRHVTAFVNWACNLTCRECWMYGDSAAESTWLAEVKRDQMSVEMWTALVDELAEGNREKVYLTMMGGEPLMHRDAVGLMRIAKTRMPDCNLDMSTNATLLPRFADAIVDSGIDDVYISIDGPSSEVNDPIRGRDAFERAVTGLKSLQEAKARAGHGPNIALNFVVTGMNYTHLVDMVRLTEQLGVEEITIGLSSFFTREEGKGSRPAFEAVTGRPFTSWAGYCNEHQHAELDPKILEEQLDEADRITGVRVLVAPTRYTNREKSRFFAKDWSRIVRETTCVKLWAQTTVLPNGQVISCTTFADTVMGSLGEQTLSEVFHSDTYTRMRQMIREGLQPICYRCCELNMDIDVDPALYDTVTAKG
ncbi:radical SAM protein [Dactylosporangium matsuzakiense]|uniref:Radical SAM/SPASM domain-containing protein n=1 Tax=Dactylosporangium matsuzakiense TaxID=53360 RepID=A0A9W6KEY5_9ACTN|nr:radical SAM protein [Dactylosporangium matsuzakiense]UWZ45850.1 radical SAM protein [Dactylosporangium matsuzakiense]GLL00063.1 radical SAM/SPASM domain-containing protein [Dactylosporangium matsuzakiense]